MKYQLAIHVALAATIFLSVVVGIAVARAGGQQFAELNDWRIAYETAGDPASEHALVFVHGANSSRRVWHRQMAGLDVGRRMMAVDLLGAGDSDKPDMPYRMHLFARSVAAAMDAEGIRCATLVSHSNGVPVAREFYRLFPERVESIVAVDGAFQNNISPEMEMWMRDAFDRPDFEEFRASMPAMMPTFSLSEDDVALITEDMVATPKHVMLGGLESFIDPAIWADDSIDVPLLILLAQQPTWTPEAIEYAKNMGPEVEYHMWAEVSHFIPLERSEEFNALVAAFVTPPRGCGQASVR